MTTKTTLEYCIAHGHQQFFLGEVWDYDCFEAPVSLGEALHCPLCHADHEDNPANSPEVLFPHACSPAGIVCDALS